MEKSKNRKLKKHIKKFGFSFYQLFLDILGDTKYSTFKISHHKCLFLQFHFISVSALSLNIPIKLVKIWWNLASKITVEKVFIYIYYFKVKCGIWKRANEDFLVGRNTSKFPLYFSAQSGMVWKLKLFWEYFAFSL